MSDSELVPRALTGDRAAIGALWRENRRWVAAVLLAHMPRAAELDDLLQEVAVIYVERLSSLRDAAAWRPWLRKVAVNVARGSARRELSRRGRTRSLEQLDVVDPADASRARDEATRAALERALDAARRLDPDYREPLLLRCLEGMSQARIAALLDLPVTTVETRLARARRMLRRQLGDGPTTGGAGRRSDSPRHTTERVTP